MLYDKSIIGEFYNNLKAFVDQSERHYSYLKAHWSDFSEWRIQARTKLLELLRYQPHEVPLKPVLISQIDRGYCLQEEIEFSITENESVRGTVLVPSVGKGPFPAVIALHDHGGNYFFGREKLVQQDCEPVILTNFKKNIFGGRSLANELVKHGFVVLCIDAFYFGSRKPDIIQISNEFIDDCPYRLCEHIPGSDEYIKEYNCFCEWYEVYMLKHILCSGATWPGILSYDDRKSVDYLLSREDVDQNRIGCCGLSIGGYRAVLLGAIDSRIRCSVAAGWMTTMESLLFDHLWYHTNMLFIPGLLQYMDLPDIAGLSAPNKLFIQQCSKDFLFTSQGMQEACLRIGQIYTKAGFQDNYSYKFYDNNHQYSLQMQEDAFLWLDMNLKEGMLK